MKPLQKLSQAESETSLADWDSSPIIYEINTCVWLRELSQKYDREINLANIPKPEIEELASYCFDAIWLMGVWHRGRATRQSALNYIHQYREALPDITADDVIGSAYAIQDYRVAAQLGGRGGLAVFREQLKQHNIKLILDYVPNHVATDHAWIQHRPDYFIQGTAAEAQQFPQGFFYADRANGNSVVIAHGRDPYFPPWIDTSQLNAFHPGLRRASIDTLIDIGSQCDGVRCDMAMLMMNAVFANVWGERAGAAPATDYWTQVIPAVREIHPQMMFLAEVYWNLEHELQLQGFDYTYDKMSYDYLINQGLGEIKAHLNADLSYLESNMRFIENHDEPRAMKTLGEDFQRPAATLICTLPGATLLHQGQLTGRRVKLPVQINRQPEETRHPLLKRFYKRLLQEVDAPVYHQGKYYARGLRRRRAEYAPAYGQGKWLMLEAQPAFEGSHSHHNLIAYTWNNDQAYRLIVVNLTYEWSACRLQLRHWTELKHHDWQLYDVLNDSYTCRQGEDMIKEGLMVEVAPYGSHIFQFRRA